MIPSIARVSNKEVPSKKCLLQKKMRNRINTWIGHIFNQENLFGNIFYVPRRKATMKEMKCDKWWRS